MTRKRPTESQNISQITFVFYLLYCSFVEGVGSGLHSQNSKETPKISSEVVVD